MIHSSTSIPRPPIASSPHYATEEPRSYTAPQSTQMVGNSPAMLALFEQIRRYASCDAAVLIDGESGTGKELVARAIHERSSRNAGPFVAINCAALPASLIASELFGYEKGAFTGAATRKRGMIEAAQHGTLFLDEVGDMPIDLQGHLLRFLQEGDIVRVGGHEAIHVDVRIIAATNVRLREAIAAGRFREDLFYRLNVLSLHVPPLRERDDDVEVLARYLLTTVSRELGRPVDRFSPAAMAAIRSYWWPGNVRELIATIRRAAVLSDGDVVELDDLKLDAATHSMPHSEALRRPAPASVAEAVLLRNTLDQHHFNVTKAAAALHVSRVTFYRMLRRNHLSLRQQCVAEDLEVEHPAEDTTKG